ncbi:MAG TPA: ABC transporter permease [Terriglobales bacterium]|nr:ABC transporter permease [Terriglobales bacterium]
MDNLLRDLRLALRRLVRERGFAAVAILTLALGIGANTAIFSVVDGALLRPLSYPQSGQLVSLHLSIPQFAAQYPELPVNASSFFAWQQHAKTLDSVALVSPTTLDLTGAGEPRQVVAARVSSSLFRVLRQSPRLGRAFLPQENLPHRNHVVVLTDAFWRSQFHADPNVLGRTIELNGQANLVVGVMPASFRFPQGEEFGPLIADGISGPVQLFRPLGLDPAHVPPLGEFNYGAFARLLPGVRPAAVRAELEGLTANLVAAQHMPGMVLHVVVTSLRDQIVGSHRLGLWLLLAAVGVILLIVCLNLANLLLVRVHGRGHEAAIRLALGASRGRLLRETLTEGLLLSLAGGVLGVAAAYAAVRWLVASAPPGVPRLNEIHLNPAALLFAFLLALLSGVLFSLWPGLGAARTSPQAALRSGGRGASESGRRLRAREWLVGAQCALTAALLIVAGLLTASYLRLMGVHKGFATGHVLTVQAEWIAGSRLQRAAFFQQALKKLQALPGVSLAGLIDQLPTQGSGETDILSMPGDTRPMVQRPLANFRAVSPDYFAALGIPLQRGRTFTDAEMAAALPPKASPIPAVISATAAAQLWPGQDPIGKVFLKSDPQPQFLVVGVAGDVRSASLATPPGMMVYLPFTASVPDAVAFELRSAAAPSALAARATVWSVNPAAAIPQIETLGQVVAASVASRRFQMSLVLAFALCALLLAALGIYGVVAYSVARRTGEIGIRITLGAGAHDLFAMVLRQGLTPVVAGLLVGVAAALAGGRLLASLLFGVQATDPVIVLLVSLLLLAAGAIACALPARRATRIDPLAALRQ